MKSKDTDSTPGCTVAKRSLHAQEGASSNLYAWSKKKSSKSDFWSLALKFVSLTEYSTSDSNKAAFINT